MRAETVKNISLNIIKIGTFIIPFIPLYISRVLFFPYITGKAFVFRILIEIVFAAWVWLALTNKEFRPRKSPVLIAISIWLLVVSAATIFGINPLRSFWSNFERMEGLIAYIHLFMYFMVIASAFNLKDWMRYLNLFMVAGIFENTYVLLQRMGILASPQGGTGRTDGTIGNPTYLAAYLIFILAIAVFLWFKSKKGSWESYFYSGMGVWTLASIYFTASRGPALGLLISLILAGFIYLIFAENGASRFINKKTVGIGLAMLVIVPFTFWLFREASFVKGSPVLSRLTSLSFSERTVTSRFSIWAMSFEGVKEYPVLGWGPENYSVVFSKYFRPELWQQEPWFDRSHNIIFDWLINAGFLGLFSYLSIFIAAFYLLWRNYLNRYFAMEESLLFGALLFAYLFQNLFVFDNFGTYMSFFTVLGLIHFSYMSSLPKTDDQRVVYRKNSMEDEILEIAAPIGLAVILIASLYFLNIAPLRANLILLNALRYQSSDARQGFDDYQKALSYGYLGKMEIREQLTRFALEAGGSPNVPADFKDKVIRAALVELDANIKENPGDPRPYLFLGGLYGRIGLSDYALSAFQEALKLSPKKQQIYFEIGDVYLQKGDYKNAVAILEEAFNLDTSFHSAAVNLSTAHILNGNQEKADQILTKSFGRVEVPDMILVQVYSQVKKYDRLAGIWRAFVKQTPDNFQYRQSLAGAYLLAGDNAMAVKVLTDAKKDFPAFGAEIDNLIKQAR